MSNQQRDPSKDIAKVILSIAVSIGWIAMFFVEVEQAVQIGAQAAFMVVLGAVFGISAIREGQRRNGNSGGRDGL